MCQSSDLRIIIIVLSTLPIDPQYLYSAAMTSNKKQSTGNVLVLLSIAFVALIAVLIAQPQPKLDWEKDFLPQANAYRHRDTSTGTIANDSSNAEMVCSGLTVVITGATSGIGMALAQFMLAKGATVVAVGRSPSKLDQLHTNMATNEDERSRIVPVVMEMSDLDSVARGAEKIKQQFDSIDILVCNAGIHYAKSVNIFAKGPETNRGLDVSFTVNYLSHFLLTEKLLPELLSSPKPLLLHMTSSYHWGADGRDLESPDGIAPPPAARPGGGAVGLERDTRAYSNSKLAQLLHTRAVVADQSENDNSSSSSSSSIRAVSVCPAWVATQIGGDQGSVPHKILELIAYPLQGNGWGLASTLRAIVDYDNANEDFYINSALSEMPHRFPRQFAFPRWVTDSGLRSLLIINLANILLMTQKFFYTARPARSSVESYDMDLAMNLYRWSKEEVKEYL